MQKKKNVEKLAEKKARGLAVYAGDFETTVYDGQESTEVWSSALAEINHDDEAMVFHSLPDTVNFLEKVGEDVLIYYHNLKFDGSFWVSYLLANGYKFNPDKDKLKPKEFNTLISGKGIWYTVTINTGAIMIDLRDSLKLLPLSLKQCGESFKTKHRKLSMEYTGYRYAGCEISPEEMEYIKNDVYVLRECLEIMFNEGHDRLTIGSCCMAEFRAMYGNEFCKIDFPDLSKRKLDPEKYGAKNLDEYIRRSYFGGWCYLVPEKANKVYKNGTVADVNSLYPSMMSSESGNYYPVGLGVEWKGNYIPERCKKRNKYYYFLRFRCSFKIKPGKLPFVHIKNSLYYNPNESLTDSMPTANGRKVKILKDNATGQVLTDVVTLTMTCTDFDLFREHYDVKNLEILDGVWFYAEKGMFDDYINKYRKMKEEATVQKNGAKRQISKLFLNNLYGKFATSTESSYMVPKLSPDGVLTFDYVKEYKMKPGYIAIGSAITSYARNFTIRAAQANYHGVGNPGFIYADTDSVHCDLQPDEIKNIPVHETAFCCWKLESSWDRAIFVRQKTYIEHVTANDLKPVQSPYYDVKCAGMPANCKQVFIDKMENNEAKLTDFKVGYEVSGKLMPRRVVGGVVLTPTTFKIK